MPPKTPAKKIWLSPTAIELQRRCPRCFWLKYRCGIAQPEGIVSRLANRFDGVIKRYFDLYRATGDLPPFLAARAKGKLQNPFKEKYFADVDDRYGFLGKLDELLLEPNRRATPIDHKTSSSDPREKATLPAYQFQLDAYAYLLERNGLRTSGRGHLIYFFPNHGERLHEGFPMVIHVATLPTDPRRVEPAIQAAIATLEGAAPAAGADCPFCRWFEVVNQER